jgi:hypothetical protein
VSWVRRITLWTWLSSGCSFMLSGRYWRCFIEAYCFCQQEDGGSTLLWDSEYLPNWTVVPRTPWRWYWDIVSVCFNETTPTYCVKSHIILLVAWTLNLAHSLVRHNAVICILSVIVTGWYRTRRPMNYDHIWSNVHPYLGSNHSWFIHKNSPTVTSRDI